MIAALNARGLKYDESGMIPNAPEGFSDWLAKNKAYLFKNDSNQYAIIQNGNFLDKVFEDPDANFYGTYFGHNDGILDFQTFGMETWDKNMFKNPLGSFNGTRHLEGNVDGYEG